jgi:DNA (cytosine-5)-methyltransferase 1
MDNTGDSRATVLAFSLRGRDEGAVPEIHGDGEVVSSLRSSSGGSSRDYVASSTVRRLTPVETERLQGFPDEWTKYRLDKGEVVEQSDSNRYKQMGNAVSVPVVEWIMKRLVMVGEMLPSPLAQS